MLRSPSANEETAGSALPRPAARQSPHRSPDHLSYICAEMVLREFLVGVPAVDVGVARERLLRRARGVEQLRSLRVGRAVVHRDLARVTRGNPPVPACAPPAAESPEAEQRPLGSPHGRGQPSAPSRIAGYRRADGLPGQHRAQPRPPAAGAPHRALLQQLLEGRRWPSGAGPASAPASSACRCPPRGAGSAC